MYLLNINKIDFNDSTLFWVFMICILFFGICTVISILYTNNQQSKELRKKVKTMNEKYVSDIKMHNRAFFNDLENQHLYYKLDYVDTILGSKRDTKGIKGKQKQLKFTICYREFEEMDCLYIDATNLKIAKVVEDVDEYGDK